MKPTRRKCKYCKEWYEPKFKTTEPCPKYECREKQLTALTPKINRVNKANAKEKLKTLSEYEAEAKKEFQKFIRLRDKDLPCISCGAKNCEEWAGGHYYAAGMYSGLMFDERNCHKQCNQYCNKYLHGNLLEYRKGLIQRYGYHFIQCLDNDATALRNRKYTKLELIEIKAKYRSKNKYVENLKQQ